ncbi:hypothetical protein TNIN_287541 [Trichonephila inaurata madagascariensis]|uniref:Uncharacterized protein n=1 Tax=Trichonephila inaurata madagascariensis TaxID=2747483 RepID=A0A8X6K056_9ARAC|nr:hypothetical protein TNIN_287541 [Trichonephila inaurata madagascariensis]
MQNCEVSLADVGILWMSLQRGTNVCSKGQGEFGVAVLRQPLPMVSIFGISRASPSPSTEAWEPRHLPHWNMRTPGAYLEREMRRASWEVSSSTFVTPSEVNAF